MSSVINRFENFKYYYLTPSGFWVKLEYGKPYSGLELNHDEILKTQITKYAKSIKKF